MRKGLLAAVISCFMAQISVSQTWQLTGSGTNNWLCIASSASGHTLIAGQYPDAVAVSTNGGLTWTNVITNGFWNSVASSADGTKLLAAAPNAGGGTISGVFYSADSGATWISNNLPVMYWGSVAMSADGDTLAAVAPYNAYFDTSGAVFVSTNSGTTWVSNNLANITGGDPVVTGVTMSADGRKMFVTGPIYPCYSTNFGMSWIQMTSAPPTYSFLSPSQYIASSADGNTLIMRGSPYNSLGVIYISTNAGDAWSLTSLPDTNWTFVASSADGKILMGSTGSGLQFGLSSALYISTNSGTSWTTNTSEDWAGVTCSADGGTLFAVVASDANLDANSGAVYKSQSIRPPLLNVAAVGSETLLSWFIPSTDFGLEQSPDLRNWTAVTNTPALNPANLEEQIVISPTNRAGCYRLATVPSN